MQVVKNTVTTKSKTYNTLVFLYSFIYIIAFIGIATVIGYFFENIGFPETSIVIVYILSVLLTARFTLGYFPGIAASVIATFAFNYFFTEPYFTFSVNDASYVLTFIIMTITALITSALTSKAKQSEHNAILKEAEASALYQLTNHLTDAKDIEEIAVIAVNVISKIISCNAAFLCFDTSGMPEKTFLQQTTHGKMVRRDTTNPIEIMKKTEHLNTTYDEGSEFCDFPIYGREAILGVLRIPLLTAKAMSNMQIKLLVSMSENIALAMDRHYSTQRHIKSHEEAVQERYRSSLLRAISHDLRTPLAGILGTSEVLINMAKGNDSISSLANDIYKEADWLHALVENILNLTRLQDGRLTMQKQLEAAEEVIGVAIGNITRRYPLKDFTVCIPDELVMVPMDARLIGQVITNLLDNAAKHTPDGNDIAVELKVNKKSNIAIFTVTDTGTGIREDDLPNVFSMFYTGEKKRADAQSGIGLGLAICEAIVLAHGGHIKAFNRIKNPGAKFVFTLPLEVRKDEDQ